MAYHVQRAVGMGGPTGDLLYKWTPDWALSVVCDNAKPSEILEGTACALYIKKMSELYPNPPMPVAPGVPINLPANPVDRAQAEAAVQAVVDARAIAQAQQTQGFFDGVFDRAENYNNQTSNNPSTALYWVLGIVTAIWLVKR